MVNNVIGMVNYVIAARPSLLNFVIADICWSQHAGGWRGGVRISGRSRFRVMDAGRSGQRIFPVAAGQITRW